MNFKEKVILFLATGFYVGKIPFAPGTFGSLLALPFCFLLSKVSIGAAILGAVLFSAIAVHIAGAAERLLQKTDPGCIVIDEMAGIWVTFIGISFTPFWICAGFLLFRIFDIVKPFPISFLEKRFSGGFGIVIDDVAAGIFANLILRAAGLYLL